MLYVEQQRRIDMSDLRLIALVILVVTFTVFYYKVIVWVIKLAIEIIKSW
jgi:hypothetical protein